MIYISLLWNFLKIGALAFGGAYGAVPLIQDIILANNWLTEEMFGNLVGISESTPGPIMVNMATYIGNSQAGLPGAILATLGVVLPSFIVILLVTIAFASWIEKRKVQAALKGIKPAIMGIVLATGVSMALKEILGKFDKPSLDIRALLILALLFLVAGLYKKLRNREISPIFLIILSAGLGIIIY